ncbi:hypothetical protein BU23DRAFT_210898 [Bimuria novae-zelandiae CBS 107.79]|uniref:Uncharacterized protein n=1 Tax=Bimuria novae-zelandiae CBS 107.79 TaxID=1447943 RepID=A0A6A5UZZ3_9PLEO|nr:hypothetical protein BU23DRAFT_210898 [Bimuria novae-zelandiae CBS 107.79]
MFLGLLIGFLLCFVSGLLLSVVLLFKDASWLRKNKHTRIWERTVALLFSICQAGLSIAGIVAIAIAFTTGTEPYWLDPVILWILQLFAGANLTWMIRGIKGSRQAIWLVYGGIVWTAPAGGQSHTQRFGQRPPFVMACHVFDRKHRVRSIELAGNHISPAFGVSIMQGRLEPSFPGIRHGCASRF